MNPKFHVGKIIATQDAAWVIEQSGQDWDFFLEMHASGNWGEEDENGWRRNDEAVQTGQMVFSTYRTLRGWKIHVCTCPDRSETTIFLRPVNYIPLPDMAHWRRRRQSHDAEVRRQRIDEVQRPQ